MPALRMSSVLAFGLAALWLVATPTRSVAGLVLSVQNSTAPSGGVGSFDVVLSSNGGSYQVSGFSVELSLAAPSGVQFTAVNTSTTAASYIFGTLQSSPFTYNTFPTIEFTASDSSFTAPYYVTLGSGSTVGLEHVIYSVAPGTAAGPVAVTVADIGGGTSLSDANGNGIAFTPSNGTITVTPAVPEPSSLALLATAMVGVASIVRARRGRGALNFRR